MSNPSILNENRNIRRRIYPSKKNGIFVAIDIHNNIYAEMLKNEKSSKKRIHKAFKS